MAKFTNISLLTLFLVVLFSCEKVIDVDLNDANSTIVIEANLTNTGNFAEVKVSRTVSYFNNSPVVKVSGAVVTIESDTGGSFQFNEVEKGTYSSNNVLPRVSRNYKLTVKVDEKKYEATSKLNPPVIIESLNYFYDEGFAFIDEGYYVTCFFRDPPGIQNFYRIKLYKNGVWKENNENFILFDDRSIDGKLVQVTLRQKVFKPGQLAKVELIALDKEAYEFYTTFRELLSANPGSAAPANPISNFSNGALGYFSAYSYDSKIIKIEK